MQFCFRRKFSETFSESYYSFIAHMQACNDDMSRLMNDRVSKTLFVCVCVCVCVVLCGWGREMKQKRQRRNKHTLLSSRKRKREIQTDREIDNVLVSWLLRVGVYTKEGTHLPLRYSLRILFKTKTLLNLYLGRKKEQHFARIRLPCLQIIVLVSILLSINKEVHQENIFKNNYFVLF